MDYVENWMTVYRIYDKESKCWRDDIVLFDDGALGVLNRSWFHSYSVDIIFDEEQYSVQFGTEISDKNGMQIFEGDICTCPNDSEGVVAYSTQIGTYCIFDFDNDLYYVLSQESSELTEIIGNVFDEEMSKYLDKIDVVSN